MCKHEEVQLRYHCCSWKPFLNLCTVVPSWKILWCGLLFFFHLLLKKYLLKKYKTNWEEKGLDQVGLFALFVLTCRAKVNFIE